MLAFLHDRFENALHQPCVWNDAILGLQIRTKSWPLECLQYVMEHGAQWGDMQPPGTCATIRQYMDPESFAWAHEHGCPCNCEIEADDNDGNAHGEQLADQDA